MTQNKHKKLKDKIIHTYVKQIAGSKFYNDAFLVAMSECTRKLKGDRHVGSIVCYGLGSFCNGIDIASRYQLALLILIHRYLSQLEPDFCDCIDVYDPSFEPMDISVLASFQSPKFRLIRENEYCARKLNVNDSRMTLFYMPHMDKFFYDNLLGANWSRAGLGLLLILGNSFKEMVDYEIESTKLKIELYYMNQIVNKFCEDSTTDSSKNKTTGSDGMNSSALMEIKIDDSSFEHPDIFNSMAFFSVDHNWLRANQMTINRARRKDWRPTKESL